MTTVIDYHFPVDDDVPDARRMAARHGDVIEGPPDSVAEPLLQFLTDNHFV